MEKEGTSTTVSNCSRLLGFFFKYECSPASLCHNSYFNNFLLGMNHLETIKHSSTNFNHLKTVRNQQQRAHLCKSGSHSEFELETNIKSLYLAEVD